MDKILNYINGEFIESLDKSWINNVDPSIGKVYSLIPDSEDKDIEQAVQSAELAFDNWSNSTIDYRSKILNNIAKLILRNMEDLARAESIDNGKPLSLAKKIAKPSEVTPMTAYLFSKICKEAGLPDGVLNIVHGYGGKVGAAITKHPKIKAISFTGGTATGKEIAKVAAPLFKKMSLELGGKNPNIVFADCDFEKAVSTSVLSSFSNQGQICLCGSRIYIERKIYAKFKEAFLKKVKKLVVQDPLSESTQIGALVSEDHMNKVLQHIKVAKEEGGVILHGGERILLSGRCKNGFFVSPTVIEGLPQNCRTNQEEIFGPVVTLSPFDREDEVIEYANGTQYGLSSTVWTKDLAKANKMAQELKAGIVWINCWLVRDLRTPFGGVKNSGVGREGGYYALQFFTEPTNVCISLN